MNLRDAAEIVNASAGAITLEELRHNNWKPLPTRRTPSMILSDLRVHLAHVAGLVAELEGRLKDAGVD